MATAQSFEMWDRQNVPFLPDADMMCDTVRFGNFMWNVYSGIEDVRKCNYPAV
jgi:hypothetical protein